MPTDNKIVFTKKYTYEDGYDCSRDIEELLDNEMFDDFPGTITITVTHNPKDKGDE